MYELRFHSDLSDLLIQLSSEHESRLTAQKSSNQTHRQRRRNNRNIIPANSASCRPSRTTDRSVGEKSKGHT